MSRVQICVENDTGIRQEQFKWKAVTNRLVNYHKQLDSDAEKVNETLSV